MIKSDQNGIESETGRSEYLSFDEIKSDQNGIERLFLQKLGFLSFGG